MTQAQMERSTPTAPMPVTNLVPGSMSRRLTWRRILLMIGPIVLIVAGGVYYLFSGRYVSTDDAYIKSRMVSVTATSPGQVIAVPATDNQTVKKGDVLVQIDPAPYQLKLESAQAELARVVQDAEQLRAQVKARQQDIVQANADVEYAQREFSRQAPLVASGAVAKTMNDKAQRDLTSAQARVAGLKHQIDADVAQLGGNIDTPNEKLPSYLAALSARDTAQYNLDHATIRAAADGRVGTVTVRTGEYVQAGQNLFPQVVNSDTWIEANVRETDLTYVCDGQPATFTVDAYPGHVFKAKLQSFSPATGSELSVLPAENATGNWVKIVQRLPLKLTPVLEQDDPPLRAGLSVDIDIDTGTYHHLPRFLGGGSAPAPGHCHG